ncbi:MAG: TlpA family protein disulfide reductase [Ectothiorhodospiraceae bacterium]|nr:TlpA family protein disulfide reductase [Ectothiorhodospiraceae bacterium]
MDAVTLGPFLIPLPRLFLFLGVVAVFGLAMWLERRHRTDLSSPLWVSLLVGLGAARLVYVVQNWPFYRDAPWEALYLWQDGYAPLAGVAATVVTALLISLYRRYPPPLLQAPLVLGLAVWFGLTTLTTALMDQERPGLPTGITLHDLQFREVPLERYAGRPVVVNLWASWCPPCRREMPAFQAAQQGNPGIHFVFPNQGESAELVRAFLEHEELDLAHVLLDTGNRLGQHFGTVGMPTTLFFDADGRLVDAHVGEVSAARLNQYLSQFD